MVLAFAAGLTTEASEDKVICEAAFRRVAGYSQKHMKKTTAGSRQGHAGPGQGTPCFLPDRVVAKTPLGGAVLKITSLKVELVVRQAAAN